MAAPKGVLGGFDDFAAGPLGQGQDFRYLALAADVVGEGESGKNRAGRRDRQSDLLGELSQGVDRQPGAGGGKKAMESPRLALVLNPSPSR